MTENWTLAMPPICVNFEKFWMKLILSINLFDDCKRYNAKIVDR